VVQWEDAMGEPMCDSLALEGGMAMDSFRPSSQGKITASSREASRGEQAPTEVLFLDQGMSGLYNPQARFQMSGLLQSEEELVAVASLDAKFYATKRGTRGTEASPQQCLKYRAVSLMASESSHPWDFRSTPRDSPNFYPMAMPRFHERGLGQVMKRLRQEANGNAARDAHLQSVRESRLVSTAPPKAAQAHMPVTMRPETTRNMLEHDWVQMLQARDQASAGAAAQLLTAGARPSTLGEDSARRGSLCKLSEPHRRALLDPLGKAEATLEEMKRRIREQEEMDQSCQAVRQLHRLQARHTLELRGQARHTLEDRVQSSPDIRRDVPARTQTTRLTTAAQ